MTDITIEQIKELNANRTQGEWKCGESMVENDISTAYVGTDCNQEYDTGVFGECGYHFSARTKDSKFIAAAPAIAELAIKQAEEIEYLNDVWVVLIRKNNEQAELLDECREALKFYANEGHDEYKLGGEVWSDSGVKAEKLLAKLEK